LPYWNNEIVPAMRSGRQILICAHGNSLRGLIKHLDQISDADIVKVNIPNAQPLVYELDADLNPVRSYYLGDAAAIEAAIKTITQQGRTS
ncbi:MAG: 2,3-bisphosphoglycerate-dependent phosphoglycerate mutase, partial [Oxalobacteraceae bacterium]|nr:2,3-bisphosphoglycerate-dependent phosphoglycerate mutase [Oxalobacteraceae bacterium]